MVTKQQIACKESIPIAAQNPQLETGASGVTKEAAVTSALASNKGSQE